MGDDATMSDETVAGRPVPPPCPICESGRAAPAFAKDGVTYHRCPQCGFVFARPPHNANLESRIEDFDPAYVQYLQEDFGDGKDHARVVAWMREFGFDEGQTLLDVGCGGGKFVRRMRPRGSMPPGSSRLTRYSIGSSLTLRGSSGAGSIMWPTDGPESSTASPRST